MAIQSIGNDFIIYLALPLDSFSTGACEFPRW